MSAQDNRQHHPIIQSIANAVFAARPLVIGLFVVLTLLLGWSVTNLKVDAGFNKLLPLVHPYMQTFMKYREKFGGANRVVISIQAKEGDIFTPAFFDTLKAITDETFFISGVDRTRVSSIFTPNIRFTEVVEDGISGGNVVPANFENTPEGLEKVRENILKSGVLGRLVANDFSGAIVSAELMEIDPNTGEKLDFIAVSHELERAIRDKFESEHVSVHVIGFAKQVGDIADGTKKALVFFVVSFLITAALVFFYSMSWKITVISLVCSLTAVIWQLGLLPILGFGVDPLSILVPFLVFAIGVSHGVQTISVITDESSQGSRPFDAAKNGFKRVLVPGGIALLSDTIGFVTILLIDIGIIREMAITASLGVGTIILTNLVLLPILMSYLKIGREYQDKLEKRRNSLYPVWNKLSVVATPEYARWAIAVSLFLVVIGIYYGSDVKIGDQLKGVPELRQDSRYNLDTELIVDKYSIGVDVLTVMAETVADGCIKHSIMQGIDDFIWHIENVPGVQSVTSLSVLAKTIHAGWNEGNLKWKTLPRNEQVMVQSISPVKTSSGLLSDDCSVMPILIFTEDHKASTINTIVQAIKDYRVQQPVENLDFALASGNVGVMAATNEAVKAAQYPMLIYLFSAIILLCLITFRSLVGTLCIIFPLALVSLLTYALMDLLNIGLKVNTLPVVALGIGIGVDYGIYIFNDLRKRQKQAESFQEAYKQTISLTGFGVLFTGVTLAVGVATWILSPLKFQADMGILLVFMFLVNMLGAIFLMPALYRFFTVTKTY